MRPGFGSPGGRRHTVCGARIGREFLIVEFCLLIDNWSAPLGFHNNRKSTINHGLLGRRLMVGQVPLEHFV